MTPSNRLAVLITIALIGAAGLTTLVLSPAEDEGFPEGDLPTFESLSQLNQYLAQRGYANNWNGNNSMEITDEQSGAAFRTDTNVQVVGVDEADTIENDGVHIFIASWDRVTIVKAYPASEMAIVSELLVQDLTGNSSEEYAHIIGIYLYQGHLVVLSEIFGYRSQPNAIEVVDWYPWSNYRIVATVVDVMDVTEPQVLRTMGLSGYYLSSRMIGPNLYLITDQYPWVYDDIVAPMVWVDGVAESLDPQDVRFDPNATYITSFTNILALNILSLEHAASSVLTSYSSVIYVSTDSMYLTFLHWEQGFVPMEGNDSNDIVVFDEEASMSTSIVRLEMNGLQVIPAAKGMVDGFLRNQFCMDEKDGILRMATTSDWWQGYSMVFTLDEDLNVIGSLSGIAQNESITAARFIDDMLYLVTYESIDPLFVIDLSDPSAPQVLGELIMPGFSSYLHPIAPGLLLGIGIGENWTLKVSLYDVSDPLHPIEVQTIEADTWAYSEAQWDHKAVVWDERHDMLFIPVYSYSGEGDAWYGMQTVYAFHVTTDGLELVEKLSNGENETSAKTVVIEDTAYTISSTSVCAWNVPECTSVGKLVYNDAPYPWYYWYRLGVVDDVIVDDTSGEDVEPSGVSEGSNA